MGAWELLVALGAGVLAGRRARHFRSVALGVATLTWIAIDLARGHFPVGSFGIETLLTAVLMRLSASELVAGVASRVILVAGAAASFAALARALPIGWRFARLLRNAAALLLLAALACREPDPARTYFTPAEPGVSSEVVQLAFDAPDRRADAHPLLPPEARTSATCLACHHSIADATDRPLARKGLHEIHASLAQGGPGCSHCHPSAGASGFPGEYPGLHARREANQACAGCHSRAGAPFWPGTFR